MVSEFLVILHAGHAKLADSLFDRAEARWTDAGACRIYLLAGTSVRVSLYIRLPVDKHKRFCAYARRSAVSANQAAEMLIDQVLAQTDPTFEWPDWLVEAVEDGLPIRRAEPAGEEDREGQETKPINSLGLRAV